MSEPANPYPDVDPQARFPDIEREILAHWKERGTFEQSVEARPKGEGGANAYVFYDGPPFANGLPHYGHLLTGYVKDVVPRYETMRGRRVERRFGWDCHGLPAGDGGGEGARHHAGARRSSTTASTSSTQHCRSSVLKYTKEWQRLRHPPGSLGRLRERLQDHGPVLHGERHVGVQAAVGQGAGLRGLPGDAVLLGGGDAAQSNFETPHGRQRTARARTRRSRWRFTLRPGVDGEDQRADGPAGLDDDPLDPALQPGASRSGPTSTTRVRDTTEGDASPTRRRRPRTSTRRSSAPGARRNREGPMSSSGRTYRPLFPYFEGRRGERVPGPLGRVRRHRGGHRHWCTWRRASARTTRTICEAARTSPWSARSTRRAEVHRARSPTGRASTSSKRTADHPRPQGATGC